MSEKKNELVNETPAKPAKPEGGAKEGMHEVDQGAQEKAAEERETSGGYD